MYDWAPAAMVLGVQAGVAVLKSPAVGEEEVGIMGIVDSTLSSGVVVEREQLLHTQNHIHGAMTDSIAGDQDMF